MPSLVINNNWLYTNKKFCNCLGQWRFRKDRSIVRRFGPMIEQWFSRQQNYPLKSTKYVHCPAANTSQIWHEPGHSSVQLLYAILQSIQLLIGWHCDMQAFHWEWQQLTHTAVLSRLGLGMAWTATMLAVNTITTSETTVISVFAAWRKQ